MNPYASLLVGQSVCPSVGRSVGLSVIKKAGNLNFHLNIKVTFDINSYLMIDTLRETLNGIIQNGEQNGTLRAGCNITTPISIHLT